MLFPFPIEPLAENTEVVSSQRRQIDFFHRLAAGIIQEPELPIGMRLDRAIEIHEVFIGRCETRLYDVLQHRRIVPQQRFADNFDRRSPLLQKSVVEPLQRIFTGFHRFVVFP